MSFQWWCSAQTAAWEWTWRPYPGVWLFLALLALGYRALLRRARDRGPVGAARIASFAGGIACLWLALDWPIGALGAGYLASVHMIQFLLIGLIAPPLLLWGIPPAAFGAAAGAPGPAPTKAAAESPRNGESPDAPREARSARARALRLLTHPIVAIIVFNILVGTTHAPAVTDTLMASQLGSFAIDVAWLGGALLFWWPMVAAAPARPYFHDLLKIAYITGQAILMTPVFVYLTFSPHPVYAVYELAPPVAGIEPLADQRVAGLMMKIVGGLILMGAVTILFFRWARRAGDDPAALQAAATAAAADGAAREPAR
ncbi:MAG TPA: cytochrome c oxidase assembly protein [Longimicrobiales bacterium]